MNDEAGNDDVAIRCGWTCPKCGHFAKWISRSAPPCEPRDNHKIRIKAQHHNRPDGEPCDYPGGGWQWRDGKEWVEKKFVPPKVGDIDRSGGVEKVVLSVQQSKGGGLWRIQSSAEPLARKRGYITQDECLGFKIEHHPPVFVPVGTPRTRPLTAADWDFSGLMKSKDARLKGLALVHELARESCRVREACRIYDAGLEEDKEWQRKEDESARKWMEAEDFAEKLGVECDQIEAELKSGENRSPKVQARFAKKQADKIKEWDAARERARLADREHSHIRMTSGNGKERQAFQAAQKFIGQLLKRLPFAVRGLLTHCIADDLPWSGISEADKAELLAGVRQAAAESNPRQERSGLRYSDTPSEGMTSWPYDKAIEIATEYDEEGRPKYPFNPGVSGLPVQGTRGNGNDAERVVTECFEIEGIKGVWEKIEVCVRWNHRDDDIISDFEDKLRRMIRELPKRKKPKLSEKKALIARLTAIIKAERVVLPDGLADFRSSGERRIARLKGNLVIADLKRIAALRLVKQHGLKEAAYRFRNIYEASETRLKPKAVEAANPAPKADVGTLAKQAVEQLQRQFFLYCPFDSEKKKGRKLGPWDHVCSLCLEHVYTETREPRIGTAQWHEKEFHCPKCDHRETMQWDGAAWFAVEWRCEEGDEHGQWRPV